MSEALKNKINELFDATKDLMSLEEIKPYCEQFNEWINTHTSYNVDTLGTYLSRYGFYKKFKSLSLEQGLNADSIPKYDGNGNVIGTELKHYVLLLCGLDKTQWRERNETTRVIDRLGNDQEVDPDTYLEVTGKLLESDDPHELAVGLIAATGRRPHEILARAKFTAINGEKYQVLFEGQGKKRGEEPAFKIATLYPATYIIKKLAQLRKEPGTQALLKEVSQELPNDLSAQNRSIENRRGNSLRRVVQEHFGGRDTIEPVLNFRNDQDQNDCKALRAAYACLATKRDCDRSVGSQMLHYARLLGHFAKENPTDKALQAISTSIGYADYYCSKTVPFPPMPQKEKLASVRLSKSDFDLFDKLQKELKLPNQQAVVARLIESHQQKVDTAKELMEAKATIAQLERQFNQLLEQNDKLLEQNNQLHEQNNQLEQEKTNMQVENPTQENIPNTSDLKVFVQQMVQEQVGEAIKQVLAKLPLTQNTQLDLVPFVTTSTPVEKPIEKPKSTPIAKEVIDWETKSITELWGTKASGAATEKIRRSFEAICSYNNTVATGDNDRLAITNLALRELSGTNGLVVGDWIKKHADEIISHHSKYGMQNSKDPNKVETYYNKRHGQEKIKEILKLINENFLDGVAMKSQQSANENIYQLSANSSAMDVVNYLSEHPEVNKVQLGKGEIYERVSDADGNFIQIKGVKSGELISVPR